MTLDISSMENAMRADDIQLLDQLLDDTPNHFDNDKWGRTILHDAASHRSLKVLRHLVERGGNVNVVSSKEGETPLVLAASSGIPEKVRFLLDNGAILQTGKSIQNPLFGAISSYTSPRGRGLPKENYTQIVKMLLDAGIDATVRYNSDTMIDMDAMAFAWMWGRQDIARLIAEHLYPDDKVAQQAAIERARAVAQKTADHNDRSARAYEEKTRT